ncbi:MAG TPA: hypothetical protein VF190_04920 [Rhodothermales bacterium]
MKPLFACGALIVGLLLAGCDSTSNDDGGGTVNPPPNIITGYYVVLDAPADAQVTYTVSEYDQYGSELSRSEPVVLDITTAGARVIDLYEANDDPSGVAVDAKLTAGTGKLRIELWHDDVLESYAETQRQNHNLCVKAGTCSR